jgi:hypothetical protein
VQRGARFIPPKFVEFRRPAISEQFENYLAVPDHARIETTSRISTNNGTWTADRAGFVRFYVANSVAGRTKAFINEEPVWEHQVGTAATGAGRGLFAVAKGDVVRIFSESTGTVTITCFYVPPKFVRVAAPTITNYAPRTDLEIVTGKIHFYVDATYGSDNNDGLTISTPMQTLPATLDRIANDPQLPIHNGIRIILAKGNTYVLPSNYTFPAFNVPLVIQGSGTTVEDTQSTKIKVSGTKIAVYIRNVELYLLYLTIEGSVTTGDSGAADDITGLIVVSMGSLMTEQVYFIAENKDVVFPAVMGYRSNLLFERAGFKDFPYCITVKRGHVSIYNTTTTQTSGNTQFLYLVNSIALLDAYNLAYADTSWTITHGGRVFVGDEGSYRTTEQLTGKTWTDGKPIYKQTCTGNIAAAADAMVSTTLIASGIAALLDRGGWWQVGNYAIKHNLGMLGTGLIARIEVGAYPTALILMSQSAYARVDTTNNAYSVWVEYTKA